MCLYRASSTHKWTMFVLRGTMREELPHPNEEKTRVGPKLDNLPSDHFYNWITSPKPG
jgi:hypothetical protein